MKHTLEDFVKLLDNFGDNVIFLTPDIYSTHSSFMIKEECIKQLQEIDKHWSTVDDITMFEIWNDSMYNYWNPILYVREMKRTLSIQVHSKALNGHSKFMKEWTKGS
jgi:hypothetical protein